MDTFGSDITDLKRMLATLQAGLNAVAVELKEKVTAAEVKAVGADLKALDQKLDNRFLWVIGLQFATLFAIIGGMAGLTAKLL